MPERLGAQAKNPVHKFAAQMRNFVYCVADPTTREALIIDAAWDVDGVFARVERFG